MLYIMDKKLPDITQRIKSIIDDKFNGNVRQFCFALGLTNSAKVNRLFLKDKRNDEYPMPSADIISLISTTFDISTDWLFKGYRTNENSSVNNITIDNKKINGEGNITNSTDITVESKDEYINIIKQQQDQINKLLELLAIKNG